MKTVVLDATELSRDWLCAGLKYQLLEHSVEPTWLNVCVPASVFEETVANYRREFEKTQMLLEQVVKQRRRLGLAAIEIDEKTFDYRAYLAERFDSRLGITILPWPTIRHAELVTRAVTRTPMSLPVGLTPPVATRHADVG